MDPDFLNFGVAGLLAAIVFKLLDKIPYLKNGNYKLGERVVSALEDFTKESKLQTDCLKELTEAHSGNFARRPDGTFKWHNNPDREKDIKETRAIAGDILHKVKKMEGN